MLWHRWIFVYLAVIGTCLTATAQKELRQVNPRVIPQKIQVDTAIKLQRVVSEQDSRMMETKPVVRPIGAGNNSLTKEVEVDSTALNVRGRRKASVPLEVYEDSLLSEPVDSTADRYVYSYLPNMPQPPRKRCYHYEFLPQ